MRPWRRVLSNSLLVPPLLRSRRALASAAVPETKTTSSSTSSSNLVEPSLGLEYPWLRSVYVPKGYWSDKANQRHYFDWLAKKLNVETPEGWYRVNVDTVRDNHGHQLLQRNRKSLYTALSTTFPEHEFLPWLFDFPPRIDFGKREIRRRYLDWLVQKLNRRTYENLYPTDFLKNRGKNLLSMYNGSVRAIIDSLKHPPPTQELVEIARQLLVRIGPTLGLSGELDSWLSVSLSQILRFGGFELLASFNFSLISIFHAVFPGHTWPKERGHLAYSILWNDPANIRACLENLAERLGFKEGDYDAWYDLKLADLLSLDGHGLLESKNRNVTSLLSFAFPEHNWDSNSFYYVPTLVPRKSDVEQARTVLEEEASRLGIAPGNFSAWYRFSRLDQRLAYHFLEAPFDYSRFKLFSAAFPEHAWYPWLFNRANRSKFLHSKTSQRHLARYVETLLQLKRPEEWYNLNREDLKEIGADSAFPSQGILIQFLRNVYPEVAWDPSKMIWSTLGSSHLHSALELLFPKEVKDAGEVYPNELGTAKEDEGSNLKPKLYIIPSVSLLVEYQGPTDMAKQIIERTVERDEGLPEKDLTCSPSPLALRLSASNSFTLLSVPFWWDRTQLSLLATIHRTRSDLFELGKPLEGHANAVKDAFPIPLAYSLSDVRMNRSYLRQWANSSRFNAFFEDAVLRSDKKPTVSQAELDGLAARLRKGRQKDIKASD